MKVRWTSTENTTHEVGWEIDHPDARFLLQLGVAEPLDDEAKAAFAEQEKYREKLRRNLAAAAERLVAQTKEQEQAAETAKHAEFERLLLAKDEELVSE
jgi:hypothetical protein